MQTLVLTCPAAFDHHPPEGHPEAVARIEAIHRAVIASGVGSQAHTDLADRKALERVHTPGLVDEVFNTAPETGEAGLDADTWMSSGSLTAARQAASAGMAGVDHVLEGRAEAVFVAARPPGHHAEPDRAMGFCLFNTIAIAAMHALEVRGLNRVAILDFDVHHGNGTQDWAQSEPRALFASIHQNWIYPGTGAAHETGKHGNIINVPIRAGTQGGCWRQAMQARIFDSVKEFEPDVLLVSAGFDAHADDPLAGLELSDADYAWVGAQMAGLAHDCASSRLVCVLEGGYDCAALERSSQAFLRALMSA